MYSVKVSTVQNSQKVLAEAFKWNLWMHDTAENGTIGPTGSQSDWLHHKESHALFPVLHPS